MGKQFRISLEAVDALLEETRALPKAQPEKLSKRHAILRLIPAIQDMKEKDYSLAAIAKYFTEKGIPITVAALKSILSHADGAGVAAGSKKRRKRKAQAQGQGGAASQAHASATDAKSQSEAASPAAEGRKSPAVQEPKQEAKPAAKPAPPPTPAERSGGPAPTTEGGVRPGSFKPRPDTEDI